MATIDIMSGADLTATLNFNSVSQTIQSLSITNRTTHRLNISCVFLGVNRGAIINANSSSTVIFTPNPSYTTPPLPMGKPGTGMAIVGLDSYGYSFS